MTDAKAQTPEVGADLRDGVAQAVVATMAAAELEARFADGQIQLVVNDQNFAGRHFQILRKRANRMSAAIHERRGLEQRDLATRVRHTTDIAQEFRVAAESPAQA